MGSWRDAEHLQQRGLGVANNQPRKQERRLKTRSTNSTEGPAQSRGLDPSNKQKGTLESYFNEGSHVTWSIRYVNAAAVAIRPPGCSVANAQSGHYSTLEEGKINKQSGSSFGW